jgi:hypothetical protein
MAGKEHPGAEQALPDVMVYQIDRTLHVCLLLVWILGIGCGVVLRDANEIIGWLVVAVFSMLVAAKIINLFPGAMRLTLNRDGFVLRKLCRDRAVRWNEIAEPFTRQVGPQLAVGYLCSAPYRRNRWSHWYHRALLGIDGWIVVWKFQARPGLIYDAMRLFWYRARPEPKPRHRQPDVMVFEGGNGFALLCAFPCAWFVHYGLTVLLERGWLPFRGWVFLISAAYLVFIIILTVIPGAVRLTLRLEDFEQQWLWRRRIVKWRDIENPLIVGPKWTSNSGVVCQFQPSNQLVKEIARIKYLGEGRDVQIRRYQVPRELVLKFMTDFWQRAQADTAPLDLPGSKD